MPELVVTDGPDAGRVYPLAGDEVTIGRGEDSAVHLSDPTVSRAHSRLVCVDGDWRVVDAGSRNQTLVNGGAAAVHGTLRDGDHIEVGGTQLVFRDHTPRGPALRVLPAGEGGAVTRELGSPSGARAHLASLYRFTATLADARRLDELYPRIAETCRRETDADRVFLLVREPGGELVAVASDVASAEDERVAISQSVIDKVLSQGRSVLASDALADQRTRRFESIVQGSIRSVMCAAVVSRGATIGILYTDCRRKGGRRFGEEDLSFLIAIAQQAGIAIENLRVRERLASENEALRRQVASASGDHDLIGESPALQKVRIFIEKVGPTHATVLLNGESGTGKELVARGLHRSSLRPQGPFVAVNCAALTESLLESELFGHVRGAFTGATHDKLGRFAQADGGTLFLDEVGELPLTCQTKFLRVLEESCFQPVGGTRRVEVDVRVIAATNRDLERMVEEGGFRADLFYRLQVIHLLLPPLRKRPRDIPLLARHFIERYRSRIGRRIEGIDDAALAALVRHRWPGNVRELKNAIERALVLGEEPLVTERDLPPSLGGGSGLTGEGEAPEATLQSLTATVGPRPKAISIKAAERLAIIAALRETGGNKARAAAILQIDRSTLYKKLKDYDIEPFSR